MDVFLVHSIEWLLVLACLVHQYSEIRDLVSCSACNSALHPSGVA